MAEHEAPTLTLAAEERLPRVPLPALEDTAHRFLAWCAPLLDPGELMATQRAVEAFLRPDGPGRVLHAALEAYDHSPGVHSWLDEFWRDRYLGRRDRIAVNANFFFLFQDSPLGQTDRAAGLLAGAVAYKLLVDEQRLPPAMQRGRPLSMEQHRHLFSTTRIPGQVRDTVRTPYSHEWPGASQARHIVVLHRGALWRLDVLDQDGRPYPIEALAAGVRAVLDAGSASGADAAVGQLTTLPRAEWAASRQRLLEVEPGNAATLDEIETALLCLCLEDGVPADPLAACDQLLHGDGGNRWFDKALSFIVFADGTAGYNGEHCVLDGTTVIGLLDAILMGEAARTGAAAPDPPAPEPTVPTPPVPAPLRFVLDGALRDEVRRAAAAFSACAADTATTTLSVDFGSADAKGLGVSPDAFAQMAFQLAHRRAKGMVGATYESIATQHFRHGRTEAMRVVTPEVLRFVAAMQDRTQPARARRAALHAAIEAHVQRARQCQAGLAPEQHLWELQLLARRRAPDPAAPDPTAPDLTAPDLTAPDLYGSPGWTTMRDDVLSTSAVPSEHVRYWGFGSTSPRCIGVGYALLPDRFNLYLSTPSAVGEQLAVFARELPDAVREMAALLGAEPGG